MVCYVKGKGRGLASELMGGDGLEEKTEKGYWSINCVLNIMFPGITVQAQRVRNMGSHIIRTVEEGIYRFIWTGRGKMNQCGYLVYGARCSDFYCGCDAYGYGYLILHGMNMIIILPSCMRLFQSAGRCMINAQC